MSIIRGPRPEGNFYILDKKISEDKRLSWAGRGLLIYLLGKPNHWNVSVQALVNETKESQKATGRDATWNLLKELIDAGYCKRTQLRKSDGTLGEMDYIITEDAGLQPHTDLPGTAYPGTVQPGTANPTQVSIEPKEVLKKTEQGLVAVAPTKPAAMTAARSSKPKDDFLLPDWIDADHWLAWRTHPKLKNATAAQKQIAVQKLAKWREAGEDFAGALENAAASGYQGLFLPDNRTGSNRSSETGYQRSMRQKYEQIAPSIAAKNPNEVRQAPVNPTTFFENLAKKQLEHKHA